jgi:hypothetical protein
MTYIPPTLIINTYQSSMPILCYPHQTLIIHVQGTISGTIFGRLMLQLTLATIGTHVIYDQMWCLWYLQKCVVKPFVEMYV